MKLTPGAMKLDVKRPYASPLLHRWPLDESTGTRVDVKGGDDMTMAGDVSSATGVIADAAFVDGVHNGDHLNVAAQVTLLASSWSLAFWIKRNSATFVGTGIPVHDGSPLGVPAIGRWRINWEMTTNPTTADMPELDVSDGAGPTWGTDVATINHKPDKDIWYLVSVTHDLGTSTSVIYLYDPLGSVDESASVVKALHLTPTTGFGIMSGGAAARFGGAIDNLSIWSGVQTQAYIRQHMGA